MRIGLYGGMFNPIHRGHMQAAHAFVDALGLYRVHVVPAKVSPFRESELVNIDEQHRVKMLELAFQDETSVIVDDQELRRGGISYTIDTLLALRELYSTDELFLLVGADHLPRLHEWKNYETITALASICFVHRPGQKVRTEHIRECVPVQMPPQDISSTEIRNAVKKGSDISHLVTPSVQDYIQQHMLYR